MTGETRDLEDEVFAAFGRAMSTAQCLEVDLLSLSVLVGVHARGGVTPEELSDLDSRLSKRTLGGLMHALQKDGYLERTMHAAWFRALDIRNGLAHRFFIDNTERLTTSAGQREVTAELREQDAALEVVLQEVRAVQKQVIRALGVNLQDFQRLFETEYRKIMRDP